jgi:AAA family ATP:ADP antiporter
VPRRRIAALEKGELGSVAWAFAQFACVLTATFVLRAVRDEMGIAGGVKKLPWLFTATFVVTMAIVPAYGWAAARMGRRTLNLAVYGALAASMLGFWVAFVLAAPELTPWINRVAFVWLSVINMVAVAAFWSSIVDIFTPAQGHRVFGIVAAGGSVGALLGPALGWGLAETVGQLPIFGASALAFVAAAGCALGLDRSVEGKPGVAGGTRPLGGGILEGLRAVARPGPLRGIAIYIALYTTTSTVIYVGLQGPIVDAAITDPAARTAWFARIDLLVNALALAAQLAFTGPMLRRMALAAVLVVLPLVTIGTFIALAALPTLGMLAIAQTIRRACEHAVAKPGRELLYATLDRDAKFKGQNAVDTVVYRATDAISAWLVRLVADAVAGLSGLVWAFGPVAIVWVWWGWKLGRASACAVDSARQPVP